MNERIKQLAEQSGINLPDDSAYNGHIYRNAIERFANLLEQEFFSQGYLAGKSDGTIETVRECCDLVREIDAMEIRKHFGVE